MTIERHCTCGAAIRGDFPDAYAAQIAEAWAERHRGRGHGRCGPGTSGAAWKRRLGGKAETDRGFAARIGSGAAREAAGGRG